MKKSLIFIVALIVPLVLAGCSAWKVASNDYLVRLEAKRQFEAEEKHLPEKIDLIIKYLAGRKFGEGCISGEKYRAGAIEIERFSHPDSHIVSMAYLNYNSKLVFQRGADYVGGVYIEEYIPGKWERELEELCVKAREIEKRQ